MKTTIRKSKGHALSKEQRLAEIREILERIDSDPQLKRGIRQFIKLTSQ